MIARGCVSLEVFRVPECRWPDHPVARSQLPPDYGRRCRPPRNAWPAWHKSAV